MKRKSIKVCCARKLQITKYNEQKLAALAKVQNLKCPNK